MARAMKDSGIPWIGEIPEGWKLRKLKWILSERIEKNDPQKTGFILSLGAAYGVIPYSEKEGGGNKAKEELTDYKLAYPNDIVLNSMNIISGSVGISNYFGCVSPVYYVLFPYDTSCSHKYYYYLFQTVAFQRSLLGLGNGILMRESATGNFNTVRMRIPMEKLGVQLLPLPSGSEQYRIASFLDTECARIDAVIEKTRASIEEYKKLKQAVITEAVTKGIRPGRKMKDSGIEWIGEIPEEWDIVKLKFLCEMQAGKNLTSEEIVPEGVFPVYGGNGIRGFYSEKNVEGECLVVGRQGALCGNVHYVSGSFWATEHAVITKPTKLSHISFLFYLLIGMNLGQYVNNTAAQPGLSVSQIQAVQTCLVPIMEQKEIAQELDVRCTEIDQIILTKQHFLTELERYKKSVIYEYVTGKKELD